MLPPNCTSAQDVKRRMDAGERVVFIDARSPDEWDVAKTQLRGSIRFRPSEIENHLRLVPQGRPIVTWCECRDEQCSSRAASALIENGWHDVHPLQGGLRAALDAGFETEPRVEGRGTSPYEDRQ